MPTSDFRLYRSNSLEILAGLLAAQLAEPVPREKILCADTVLIPHPAMGRWLQRTLARTHGIVANVVFITPGEYVTKALDANLPIPSENITTAILRWRLYGALSDGVAERNPACSSIAEYLKKNNTALTVWSLANALANVFEKYMAWRRDWLLNWEENNHLNDAQACLWKHIASGLAHRARRVDTYLKRYAPQGNLLPQGLPDRLFVFATSNVSPDVLRVIASHASCATLHFYLPTITPNAWGDIGGFMPANAAIRLMDTTLQENPLFTAWGNAERAFMALLASYEVVHPSGEISAYDDPSLHINATARQNKNKDTLLRYIQADIFHRRPPPKNAPRVTVHKDDPSLQIHACATPLRELQILRDQLCALCANQKFDSPIRLEDIAILAPNIAEYTPYLPAVFGPSAANGPMHYTVTDGQPLANEPIAQMFLKLLHLPIWRFGLQEVCDVLRQLTQWTEMGVTHDAIDQLQTHLYALGLRWGLITTSNKPADYSQNYTWQFALERIMFGYALGEEVDIHGIASWPYIGDSMLVPLNILLRLLKILAQYSKDLRERLSPHQWKIRLFSLLDTLYPPQSITNQHHVQVIEKIHAEIITFSDEAFSASPEITICPEVVRQYFEENLCTIETPTPLLAGGISIGQMIPLRMIPFRVICLLGMNDGAFPREDTEDSMNRLTQALSTSSERLGDRSRRQDDRLLFLQLVNAAQDVLYISYIGNHPRDGSLHEPSTVVSTLLDIAAMYHQDSDVARNAFVVQHPLQPFSKLHYNDIDTRRFSYRADWQHVAQTLMHEREPKLPQWFRSNNTSHCQAQPEIIDLASLTRFFTLPSRAFLRNCSVHFEESHKSSHSDWEALYLPNSGYARKYIEKSIIEQLQQNQSEESIFSWACARSMATDNLLSRKQWVEKIRFLQPYVHAMRQSLQSATGEQRTVRFSIRDTTFIGNIASTYPECLAYICTNAPSGREILQQGLEWLFCAAAGHRLPLIRFENRDDEGIAPYVDMPEINAEIAQEKISDVFSMYTYGLHHPLPFGIYSGWEYYRLHQENPEKALQAAQQRWSGNTFAWNESQTHWTQLALRDYMPFQNQQATDDFIEVSIRLFSAIYNSTSSKQVYLPKRTL